MASLTSRRLYIDREQLIDLVHERPVIWNKKSPQYKIKSARNEAWREICSILNCDYDNNLNHSEKVEFYMAVVRAWTTTRDGWVRSLKRGQANIRPYYYHDKLLFLQDVINPQFNAPTDTSFEKVEYLYAESDDETKSDDSEKSDKSEVMEVKPDVSKLFEKKNQSKRSIIIKEEQSDSNEAYEKELRPKRLRAFQSVHQSNRGEEVMIPFPTFEDRHLCFFKSIQPSLAALDEGEVLEFQSGVITLLQSIRSRHSHD